jgi:hypothetical protein
MTFSLCSSFCSNAGYSIAGVEYGSGTSELGSIASAHLSNRLTILARPARRVLLRQLDLGLDAFDAVHDG